MIPWFFFRLPQADRWRYERKFLITTVSRFHVEAAVAAHPARFREMYPPRHVNNIYLDTFRRTACVSNLDGALHRAKIRIRWYGEHSGRIAEPTLEIKIKQGLLGAKAQYPLQAIRFDGVADAKELRRRIQACGVPEPLRRELELLEPALFNRYRRKYFESRDRRYRITVDSGMEFQNAASGARFSPHEGGDTLTVLELKYASEDDGEAHRIAQGFPFTLTRHSKYVTGLLGLLP